MEMQSIDEVLTNIEVNCRVTVEEARELSWRKFYNDVGGKDNLKNIDGKDIVGKFLKDSEKCFSDILENRLSDDELQDLIELDPTDIWINDHNNAKIRLKSMTV